MGSIEAEIAMDSGELLDAVAIAAEASRPPEPNNMFSPRSSAALTLSSISTLQSAAPQQTLFHGEGGSSGVVAAQTDENSSSIDDIPITKADSVTKDDFCPPKEPKVAPAPDQANHKTRRVSEGVVHSTERLHNERPRAPLQRATSAIATPGGSGNKLSFGPPTDARDMFHPPHPAIHHGHHPSFFYMYPSHTPHSLNRNDAENHPNQNSTGKGNSPDNGQPIPYNPSEPQKFSPMHNGPFHSHDRKQSQQAGMQHQQQQHHHQHHQIDFQPPAWKTHSSREHRHLAPAFPASYRPRRSMPMPAPVTSGGGGSWSEPFSNSNNSNNAWEPPQQPPHGGVPNGTPFIMHQGQFYPYYPQHHPGMMMTQTPQKKQCVEGKGKSRGANYRGAVSSGSSGRGPNDYPRTKKSLGQLAEGFIKIFEDNETGKRSREDFEEGAKQFLSGDPNDIVIDQVAMDLMVERRRIYDVVNILEALQVVVKKGRNTYMWKGRSHLVCQFALMQQEAAETWPEYAAQHGIRERDASEVADDKVANEAIEKEESKSLTRLSQLFLQIFLVGFDNVNLPQVSELIHGRKTSAEEFAKIGNQGQEPPKDPHEFHKMVGRGLKTKIRRLYDVANVLLAVGLLRKTENRIARTVEGKRPHFHWNFEADAKQLRSVYESLEEKTKKTQNPFLERIVLESTKMPSPEKKPIETKVVAVEPTIKPSAESSIEESNDPPFPDNAVPFLNPSAAKIESAKELAAPAVLQDADAMQQASSPPPSAAAVKMEPPSECFKEVEINATPPAVERTSSVVSEPLASKEVANSTTCTMDEIIPAHYGPKVMAGTENVAAHEGKDHYFDPIASEVARGGQLLMKSMI